MGANEAHPGNHILGKLGPQPHKCPMAFAPLSPAMRTDGIIPYRKQLNAFIEKSSYVPPKLGGAESALRGGRGSR